MIRTIFNGRVNGHEARRKQNEGHQEEDWLGGRGANLTLRVEAEKAGYRGLVSGNANQGVSWQVGRCAQNKLVGQTPGTMAPFPDVSWWRDAKAVLGLRNGLMPMVGR